MLPLRKLIKLCDIHNLFTECNFDLFINYNSAKFYIQDEILIAVYKDHYPKDITAVKAASN